MIRFDPDTHSYWNGDTRVPSVTQILSPLTNLGHIPKAILQRAADRGTAVHKATELFDLGMLDHTSISDEVKPYLDAWIRFLLDHKGDPIDIEQLVYHDGLAYAGTLDRRMLVDGVESIVDIKTSKTIYPTVGPQLAAYAHACDASLARHAVQLKADGTYALHSYSDPADWSVFLSLRTLIGWADQHQSGIHYEPTH